MDTHLPGCDYCMPVSKYLMYPMYIPTMCPQKLKINIKKYKPSGAACLLELPASQVKEKPRDL